MAYVIEGINLIQYLPNYGTFDVTVRSFNDEEGYMPSKVVHNTFTFNGAVIRIDSYRYLRIVENIPNIHWFEILSDGLVIDTVEYDGSEEWNVDLNEYEIETGTHYITVRAVGEGVHTNLSNSVKYYAGVVPIYGVSGFLNSSPALTRTDEATDLTFSVNTATGEIQSDFNNVFPWDETEIVTDEFNNKFLKFPRMYFRVGADENKRITDIAVSAAPHDEGDWYEVAPFMYSIYGGAVENSKLVSRSGLTRQTSATRSSFRTYAKAVGTDYCQLDLYHVTVVSFLFWIEFATRNCNSIMTGRYSGSGSKGGTAAIKTGGTDNIATPSGYELEYLQMRYHYIEDFYGNLFEWVDGVYSMGFNTYDYVSADPTKYVDSTTGLEQLKYKTPTSNYSYPTVMYMGWDDTHPFLVRPTLTTNNSSYNTYFNVRESSRGSAIPYFGTSYNATYTGYGVMFNGHGSNSSYSNVGGRLLKYQNVE